MEISCRARKKRCYHVDKVERIERRVRQPSPEAVSESVTRESSPRPHHVNNYIPETILADLEAQESDPSSKQFDAGQAQPQSQAGRNVKPGAEPRQLRQLMWYQRHKRRAATPKLSEHHRRYLVDVGALLELPRTTTDALLPIYISLLDDLIPILDGSSVFREYSNGQASPYLVRAMCLVTCKTKQAVPFLRMTEDGTLLQPLDFSSKLLAGLDAAIKADLEPDRITKVQILALMHQHNDGVGGLRRASSHLSQAICEAWSLSLHFSIPGISDQEQCDFLWWSLRNLDRLSKPIMASAPFLTDDSDVAIGRIAPREDSYRTQLMSISLRLGDLMAAATIVYKGSSKATADDEQAFPSFSEIMSGTNIDRFHRSHRAYLEIWYCVAAMLSCRYSGPGSDLYNRRIVASERILAIISQEGFETLPPLPLVPYAMCMATTVIYRAFRDGQRDTPTAHRHLSLCSEALAGLSQLWTSAKGVAKLAKRLVKVLSKTDKATSTSKGNERGQAESGKEDAKIEPLIQSSSIVQQQNDPTNLGALMPTPISQVDPTFDGAQGTDTGDFQKQLTGDWPGADPSYTQLDTAFHDLYDYGMPNVFRDHATWEFLHVGNDEECSAGSELLLSSALTSPDMDFNGYHNLQVGSVQEMK